MGIQGSCRPEGSVPSFVVFMNWCVMSERPPEWNCRSRPAGLRSGLAISVRSINPALVAGVVGESSKWQRDVQLGQLRGFKGSEILRGLKEPRPFLIRDELLRQC